MNTSSSNARLRPFRPVPFGRYTLLSQLATGGMGEIFLARLEGAQGFEKLCVIKKILPQLAADPEFVGRFVGEARTLVKLSHGSIAQVLDMGLHEGEAYMALEYVDGKDLRKVAARARDRQKPLPLTFVLFVMGRVLDALAYAHRKKGDDDAELNLVHRDISPQNILISYEGEVKVIDFGLAKSRLSAAKTNPSIILGKFLYMSPEQARHQPVDRRSDLYAVGLCLYELISGKNPFDQLPPGELMSAVVQPAIRPLGEVMPGVPPMVSQVVMKALAVEPAQRFQTAEELRGRLNACMLELDPGAGPESVSRYMHELFAPEYQAERRLLTSLKDAGRAPEPEPVVIGMPEGAPQRPAPTLPPKTIRLDGSVEPLSFQPTPRTREGGPVRDDGETRPAVVVDEPTRPAVPVESIEKPARPRSSLSPATGSPTVDISGLDAPVAPRAPALVPASSPPGASRAPTVLAVPTVAPVAAPRPATAPPVMSAEPGSGASRPMVPPRPPAAAPPGVAAEAASSATRPAPASLPRTVPVPVLPSEPVSGSGRAAGAPRAAAPPVLPAEPGSGSAPMPGSTSPTREVPVSAIMLRASVPPTATAPVSSAPRAAPQPPSATGTPTREVPVSSSPISYPPGTLPAVPVVAHVSPREPDAVPIEATPAWSRALHSEPQGAREPLPGPHGAATEEVAAWDPEQPPSQDESGAVPWEASGAEQEAEVQILPFDDEEAEGQAGMDVRLADTDPRIQMPRVPNDDTQPRVSLADVYRENTHPRVVLDQSLTQDMALEEESSQNGRSRPGARGARRRVTSTGLASVASRPAAPSRMASASARDESEELAHEEDAPPASHEITRRTGMPRRPMRPLLWVAVGLGLLLLGGGVGALFFLRNHPPEQVNPPPAPRPVLQTGHKSATEVRKAPPPPSEPAPAAQEQEPSAPADSAQVAAQDAGPVAEKALAAVPEAAAPDAGSSTEGDAGTAAAAPAEALAAAPAPVAEPGPVEPAEDPAMLAPLSSGSNGTTATPPNKRTVVQRGKRITSSRTQSTLQKEWARTRGAFKALTRIYACENLEFLCSRYENLEADVVGTGDVENAELLGKVRALYRDIQKKQNGS